MNNLVPITLAVMRRLAIRAQRLDRLPATNGKGQMLAIIRQLGCLQIDPLNVVARSPLPRP